MSGLFPPRIGPARPALRLPGSGSGPAPPAGGEPALTLRVRFALSAPAAPDWFQPAMPPRPERPRAEHFGLDDAASLRLNDWAWERFSVMRASDFTAEQWPSVQAFVEAITQHERAIAERQRQQSHQILAQWPWFYADLVLAARDAREP